VSSASPSSIAYDGIRLAIEFFEEGKLVDSDSKRWYRMLFKPIWFAVSHSSFEDRKKSYIDFDPVDAIGIYPAVDHAQFRGLELFAYRFFHYDEVIRVITLNQPKIREIKREERYEKVSLD
jgi:hypothetical protein